jgi:hypothetical protein
MVASLHVRALFALAAVLGLFAAAPAAGALIETQQSGSSSVRVNGAVVAEESDSQTDGHVSVVAIHGNANTPEVRTAARSANNGELAANVRMDDKFMFSNTLVDETISVATLVIRSAPDNALLRRASLDFVLPPSFMEITSNQEIPFNALEMVLLADLRVCLATICSSSDSRFSFQAIMSGSWQTFSNNIVVNGDPGLDLDPLRNPQIVDVGGPNVGFIRTTTISFDAFSGHLDLGLVPTGAPLTVEYQLQTRGSGRLLANIGLAGINDPFVLDTDPVQAGTLTLAFEPAVAVPEAQTWALLGGGLLLMAGVARRRMLR